MAIGAGIWLTTLVQVSSPAFGYGRGRGSCGRDRRWQAMNCAAAAAAATLRCCCVCKPATYTMCRNVWPRRRLHGSQPRCRLAGVRRGARSWAWRAARHVVARCALDSPSCAACALRIRCSALRHRSQCCSPRFVMYAMLSLRARALLQFWCPLRLCFDCCRCGSGQSCRRSGGAGS